MNGKYRLFNIPTEEAVELITKIIGKYKIPVTDLKERINMFMKISEEEAEKYGGLNKEAIETIFARMEEYKLQK